MVRDQVRDLALWAVENLALGDSAPYLLAIARDRQPLPLAENRAKFAVDRDAWHWWLDHCGSEESLLRALSYRADIPEAELRHRWSSASELTR